MKLDTLTKSLTFNRLDPLSADSTTYQFINPFTMDENDDDLMLFGAGNKLWRNNNLSSIPYNDDHTRNDIGWSTYTDGAFKLSYGYYMYFYICKPSEYIILWNG